MVGCVFKEGLYLRNLSVNAKGISVVSSVIFIVLLQERSWDGIMLDNLFELVSV